VTQSRSRLADHEPDPKAIAARIEHTRGEISKTLAAIAERLSPERLAEEAIGAATKLVEQAEAAAAEMADQAEQAVDDTARDAVEAVDTEVRQLTR
jgi:hypothetical protein